MADNNNNTFQTPTPGQKPGSEDAANLIRGRIDDLHTLHQNDAKRRSAHQMTLLERFWTQHHSHPDKEAAWNKFYNDLTDTEKHQLWQEAQPQHQPAPTKIQTGHVKAEIKKPITKTKKAVSRLPKANDFKDIRKGRFAPLLTAFLVVFFVLTLNYNEVVVAQVKQYVTPGAGQNSPTIIDPNSDIAIGKESRLIIPKINVDVPVVYDIKTYDEAEIQAGLERGVVHYNNTSVPGQAGNNVIVGHSSNNFFNGGKYKFAFVLLERLEMGDTFIMHYEGERYIYRVNNKVVIEPDDFSVVQPTATPSATLITCTPPGTSWKRLAIQAEQISPSPTEKQTASKPKPIDTSETQIVPGNSPSLLDRIWGSIF
jgi:sortase A